MLRSRLQATDHLTNGIGCSQAARRWRIVGVGTVYFYQRRFAYRAPLAGKHWYTQGQLWAGQSRYPTGWVSIKVFAKHNAESNGKPSFSRKKTYYTCPKNIASLLVLRVTTFCFSCCGCACFALCMNYNCSATPPGFCH